MNNIIDEYKKIALSDTDLMHLLNNKVKILLYPDLVNFNNIDELFYPFDACIILFLSKPNFGHWVLLFKRYPNIIEFFNSYGGYPDDSLVYISDEFRKKSGQCKPYLSNLLYKSPYILHYNEHKFQCDDKNINTCGRWVVIRYIFKILSLKKFNKLIKKLSKQLKTDGDGVVTILTSWINF